MSEEQKTISILFKALREIEQTGTNYPPHWGKYTDQQKIDFPPHRTKSAQIALDALNMVTKEKNA